MSSVLFVVHPTRAHAKELAAEARAWWEANGFDVVEVSDLDAAEFAGGAAPEFAISFGGDGTILRTVQLASEHKAPVLGINLGRMGYLAEVEPAGMIPAFSRLVAGDYKLEERMLLEVTLERADHPGPAPVYRALNEAIIERGAPGFTIRVEVAVNGRRFLTYVADGLLVCTPTGSTAYNLSARGPVVSPTMRALVLTPVAPHLVFDRSLVLGPDETVGFTLLEGRKAALALDGATVVPLSMGDRIECRAAGEPARFAVLRDRDFHSVLRSRFSIADR